MRVRDACLWISLLFVGGCGSKGAVALTTSIESANVELQALALGTRLGGGFDLLMDLGPEAESDTQVTLEAFALVRGAETLVSPLEALPEGAEFPLTVPKGGRRQVHFAIGSDTRLVDPATAAGICAGALQIAGALRDSLNDGKLTPLKSRELTPSGC
jgi:hypothetical protein